MDLQHYHKLCHQPNIFNRGSLELTFRLLRKRRPALALIVQNSMAKDPLEKPLDYNGSPVSDYFNVNLTQDVIDQIVQSLSDAGMEEANRQPLDTGRLILIRTLLLEWLNFAQSEKEQQKTQIH